MPTKYTQYACNECDKTYASQREAYTCEYEHVEDRKRELASIEVKRLLPERHNRDTKYTKHCVDCGVKLIEWEREWNGHDRPARGEAKYLQQFFTDFGGARCQLCRSELVNLVVEAKGKAR